jgi:hypothetical protein
MSELTVGQLRGLTINDNIVTVPTGHSLYAPGHVVQVVQGTTNTQVTTTSATYVTTGLTATITPSFAASKIMIFAESTGSSPSSSHVGFWTIFRGTVSGTDLANDADGMTMLYSLNNGETRGKVSGAVLDSPNTTSPVTYTFAFKAFAGGTIATNYSGSLGSMILMEIAQ